MDDLLLFGWVLVVLLVADLERSSLLDDEEAPPFILDGLLGLGGGGRLGGGGLAGGLAGFDPDELSPEVFLLSKVLFGVLLLDLFGDSVSWSSKSSPFWSSLMLDKILEDPLTSLLGF